MKDETLYLDWGLHPENKIRRLTYTIFNKFNIILKDELSNKELLEIIRNLSRKDIRKYCDISKSLRANDIESLIDNLTYNLSYYSEKDARTIEKVRVKSKWLITWILKYSIKLDLENFSDEQLIKYLEDITHGDRMQYAVTYDYDFEDRDYIYGALVSHADVFKITIQDTLEFLKRYIKETKGEYKD